MTVLTNAAIVLPDEVIEGHIVVEDGRIAALGTGPAPSTVAAHDVGGDLILPGLVELHTDHLETHVAPRPGVTWNMTAAIQAHDAQIAASGITTVLDCLRVGSDADNTMTSNEPRDDITSQISRDMAAGVDAAKRAGRLRADHLFHLRCEVSVENAVEAFELFDDCEGIVMISLMDHTPGQRQFASLDAYRLYYQGKSGMSDADFDAFQADRIARANVHSDRNRRTLSERARARGLIIASHDDATDAHVAEAIRDGVRLAEFPTTVEAAGASREAGMAVLMGAPNLVRGGSHSGNVSASELADRGLLDIVSSDYVPFSLIQSAFVLSEREGWSLPRAVATVTKTPAETVGLSDRGVIAVGRRADLVRVAPSPGGGDVPLVRCVWREGVRVA